MSNHAADTGASSGILPRFIGMFRLFHSRCESVAHSSHMDSLEEQEVIILISSTMQDQHANAVSSRFLPPGTISSPLQSYRPAAY